MEAVLIGFNKLLVPWLKACDIKPQIGVYVDNQPVVAQLNRKMQAHWQSARGLSSATAEVRLQLIEDLIETCKMDVSFLYVPSEENLADALTRIPDFLMLPKPEVRRFEPIFF